MSYYFRPANSREQNLFIIRTSIDNLTVNNFTNKILNIKASKNYFKVIDNNDLLQEEYKDIEQNEKITNELTEDLAEQTKISPEADKLIMRSVKMDIPTLDKYVKRTYHKKKENIILPKSREVDITNPELKNKGIKKNITNIYEDNQKNEDEKNT